MSNTVAAAEEEGAYTPYDQFSLFGDSITEYSNAQDMGFGFSAALQNGRQSITNPLFVQTYTDTL